jgi:Leucine-rich repeat (LRR) protein
VSAGLIGGTAFALYGLPFVGRLIPTGRLESLGVTVQPGPSGGLKVTARQSRITNRDLVRIAALSNVTHLDLYGCTEVTSDGFASLGNMASLRKLNLTGTAIKDLRPLAACVNLQALSLDRSGIHNPSLACLCDTAALSLLSVNNTMFDDACLRSLGPKPSLTALYLAGTEVSGEVLPILEHFPQLKTLNLSKTRLTDADLRSDHWPKLARLEILFLNDLLLTDSGLEDFRATVVEKLPGLKSLGLSNTRITTASFDVLRQLPQLETIRLNGTPIPKEDIESLRLEMPHAYIEGN